MPFCSVHACHPITKLIRFIKPGSHATSFTPFCCAVQDVAAKTLRVDRKTAPIFGQKEDCAVAAITELMSIVFRELRRQVERVDGSSVLWIIFFLVNTWQMADLRNCSCESHTVFIELYQSFPCLWRIKSKEYCDRDKKRTPYEKLI